jgi:hypothetical protein
MALWALKNLDLPEFIILPLYKKGDKVVVEEYLLISFTQNIIQPPPPPLKVNSICRLN